LPGASAAGCAGSHHDCEPRDDGHNPVPGITGVAEEPSLGVAENALPCPSIAHTYDVSASGAGSPCSALGNGWRAALPAATLPASGMPGAALRGSISLHRASEYAFDSSASIGTSTNFGSP